MIKNVRFSQITKESLDWVKTTYSFSTYDVAVSTVIQFFKINNVSPRDILSNNTKQDTAEKHLLLLNEFKILNANLKREFKPLIEIYKAVERDQLKPIHRKIDTIYTNLVDDKTIFENTTLEKKEHAMEEVPKLNKQIINLNKKIEELSNSNANLHKIIDDKDVDLKGCRKYLTLIFSRVSVEKNTFGKDKILVDVSDAERKEMNDFFDTL